MLSPPLRLFEKTPKSRENDDFLEKNGIWPTICRAFDTFWVKKISLEIPCYRRGNKEREDVCIHLFVVAFKSWRFHMIVLEKQKVCHIHETYFQKSLRQSIVFWISEKNLFVEISFYRVRSHDFMVFLLYCLGSKQRLSGHYRRNWKLYLSFSRRWETGSITVFPKKSQKVKKTLLFDQLSWNLFPKVP